jgi:basic membrane protein A
VAEDTKALVETSKASLISGELQVFKGPIVDNTGRVRVPEGQLADFAEMPNTTDWLVQGASGQIS